MRLMENLAKYGLREPSARRVAKVYENRGAGAALVELYRIGWKVVQKEGEQFALIRGTPEDVGEEELEA